MKERIIQFGTGSFLRAFADDFIDQMHHQGLYDGRVVVVSPTDSARSALLNAQHGKYNLVLRGLENGRPVSTRREICSISRCINPYRDFDAFLALAENPDFHIIISNTTEAGIVYTSEDGLHDRPAGSFPAKLTQLLYARFQCNLPGFLILACELIDQNGEQLKKYVLQYAEQWALPNDFKSWVVHNNTFCNTLVDRIVTGYPQEEADALQKEIGWQDQLLDTAERYALWAIEGDFEKVFPLQAAGINVQWCRDVSVFKKQKVRILNGLHTAIVFPGLLCGLETVGDCIADTQLCAFINSCLKHAILPALGDTPQNRTFAASVLERFANPFIHHRLQSVALNSVSKFAARVLPTILDLQKEGSAPPKTLCLSLAALIAYYKQNEVSDLPVCVEKLRCGSLYEILNDSSLWGTDLTSFSDAVCAAAEQIQRHGIRPAIVWSLED